MTKAKALNDTQIKFLLRIEQGQVMWQAYSTLTQRSAYMVDEKFKWSTNTMDAMISRGWITLPGRMDADRRITLTEDGARMAAGLRTSWVALAGEVA